jgi:hypothetical protein
LCHAADDRNGTITKGHGQKLDNEVVAELGGAILLECLGYSDDSDRGGCWEYIRGYCAKHNKDTLGVCQQLRFC